MTHSRMVQTRRRREADRKRQARIDKLAKKLSRLAAPGATAPDKQSTTAA